MSSVGAAAVDGGWSVDPRLHVLGSRGVFPADVVPAAPSASTGALVGDERLSAAAAAAAAGSSAAEEAGEAEYRHFLWRVAHGVGEGPVEIPHAEALPLEYNLAGLNAVSFKKGCYLGQASPPLLPFPTLSHPFPPFPTHPNDVSWRSLAMHGAFRCEGVPS